MLNIYILLNKILKKKLKNVNIIILIKENIMNYEILKNMLIDIQKNNKYEDFFDIIPKLIPLKDTIQDNYYHAEGDVWTHTKMVCDSLLNSNDFQNSSEEEKFILFYSCLLHDILKPLCTKTEGGRVTSKGHSKIGAIDSRIILWEMEVPFHIRESISNIIANHQVPFFAFNNKQNISAEYVAHKLSWELPLNLLFIVAKADMQGRYFEHKNNCLNDIELFKILSEEEECLYNQKKFPDTITRMKYFRSKGAISSDYHFFKETGSNVTVMCGLPASGKDTWSNQNSNGRPILSFDDAIIEMGLKHNQNVGKAIHKVIDDAKTLLRNQEPFIWNATHLSSQMRNKTLDLLFNYDAQVSIQYLECPKNDILKRNNQRDSTLTNNKIIKMLHKWEVPTLIEAHNVNYNTNISLKNKYFY